MCIQIVSGRKIINPLHQWSYDFHMYTIKTYLPLRNIRSCVDMYSQWCGIEGSNPDQVWRSDVSPHWKVRWCTSWPTWQGFRPATHVVCSMYCISVRCKQGRMAYSYQKKNYNMRYFKYYLFWLAFEFPTSIFENLKVVCSMNNLIWFLLNLIIN